jgi:hypothetical protein
MTFRDVASLAGVDVVHNDVVEAAEAAAAVDVGGVGDGGVVGDVPTHDGHGDKEVLAQQTFS